MLSKQETFYQIGNFKKNAKGCYSLTIPSIIASTQTIEEAYMQIGRNAADCLCFYDSIAYREDLYDVLSSYGLPPADALNIMQKVRKGLASRVKFDDYPIPQTLKNWCQGVRYLPSRKIVITAIAEIEKL